MRTTVTLDPDVEALLKKKMNERGLSFKEAINETLRTALARQPRRRRYTFPTYDMGEPKVDLTHANRLADELGDEEIIRKLRLGK